MKKALLILAFWLGICLAGSDGNYFPWLNLFGVAVTCYSGIHIIEVFES